MLMTLRTANALLLAIVACGGEPRHADTARVATSAGSVTKTVADSNAYPVVRGLYLNRFAAQSSKKLHHLLSIADSSEINAFVIDMKDEFGLNYRTKNAQFAKNAGTDHGHVADVKALVDTVKAHGLLPIAR